MANLLDGIKDMISDAVVRKAADMIGIENSTVTSALGKFLPAIIGGLISKGSTNTGAGGLIDLFKKGGYGDDNLKDLGGIFTDSNTSKSWLDTGGDLLGNIFGNNQSSILEKLIGMTGLKQAGGSMLMKFLAPIVVNKLAGMVFKNGWGADKLSSYLGEQKSSISSMIPGLSGLMGFASEATSKATSAASKETSTSSSGGSSSSGGGNAWWKWLLPLLILAGLAWYLTKDGCNKKSMDGEDTSMAMDTSAVITSTEQADNSSTETTETVVMDANMDYSKFNVSDNGDIIDGSGKIIYKAGTYGLDMAGNVINNDGKVLIASQSVSTGLLDRLKAYLGKYSTSKLTVNASGDLVDQNGKVVYKKGEYTEKDGFYYDNNGNKLGRIWGKIVQAVKDAAGAGLDAMKSLFSDMVTKKAGAKTNYELSNITFDKTNNRITNFSKNEVEGLAAALKENANGKITVVANTNDGKDEKENKKLAKSRAEVVHDMLVTLGVPKGQISFEAGDGAMNKVEILVK